MTTEREALAAEVFPEMARRLETLGAGLDDFRVAMLDSCPTDAGYHTRGETEADCNFSSGQVWMESSSPDLEREFTCVGDLYVPSNCQDSEAPDDDEQPAAAALASLTPPFSTDTNAGFLRDDALLVIVGMTDEDEFNDTPAQEIYDALVAVKGDVRRMVFYGIGGEPPDGCTNGTYGSATAATKLRAITQLFEDENRGVWKDICVGDLVDGLDDAFQVIEQACEEFPPVD